MARKHRCACTQRDGTCQKEQKETLETQIALTEMKGVLKELERGWLSPEESLRA